jgi:hypothetical protein
VQEDSCETQATIGRKLARRFARTIGVRDIGTRVYRTKVASCGVRDRKEQEELEPD